MAINENPTPEWIWQKLMLVMAADNCHEFNHNSEDQEGAIPYIQNMMEEGYFMTSDTDDLDGDFWMMVGEDTEATYHFRRSPASYTALSAIMDDVFNR